MSDIQPCITPEQFRRYSEYYEIAARPFLSELANLKLGAGRRFTVRSDGSLSDETLLFTPEEKKYADQLREAIQQCRDLAMKEATRDFLPPTRHG